MITEERYEPKKKVYNNAAIIPLIGGLPVGAEMASGNKPNMIFSYPAFMGNDQHIRRYWPDIPYVLINPDTNKIYAADELDEVLEGKDLFGLPWPDNGHKDVKKLMKKLDYVNSTCPCAGLSMMNSSTSGGAASRGSDAVQNEWMYTSAKFVLNTLQPKVFFGENAPGLYTITGQGVVDKLYEIAKEAGYSMSLFKTNTIYHGIPQKRERTFYFFWKGGDKVPEFNVYRRDHVSYEEYLAQVPKDALNTDMIPGIADTSKNAWVEFIKHKEGANWRDAIHGTKTATHYMTRNKYMDDMIDFVENIWDGTDDQKAKLVKNVNHIKNKISMGKGWWDNSPHFFKDTINAVIGRTITATVHPVEDRTLNVRETMHLMGLPHDFTIPTVKHYNHVAQNVPTCTARDVTSEVLRYIDGESNLLNETLHRQSNSGAKVTQKFNAQKLF